MKKDAYYFPHFCNARHDRKILRLRKELGIEGYGIFFMLLEILRDQIDFKYPIQDIDLLAEEFGTSEQKIRVVIYNYHLFEVDEVENFFSPKLMLYLQPYLNIKEQRRLAGIKSGEARRRKLMNGSSTEVERELNENEQSKVKESKVKESSSQPPPPEKVFQDNIGMLTPIIFESISHWIDDGIEPELISLYIETAVKRGKRNWAYIEKMIRGNYEDGIKTVEQYNSLQKEKNIVITPRYKEE
jgi:DnaD/phage-associated family protein